MTGSSRTDTTISSPEVVHHETAILKRSCSDLDLEFYKDECGGLRRSSSAHQLSPHYSRLKLQPQPTLQERYPILNDLVRSYCALTAVMTDSYI